MAGNYRHKGDRAPVATASAAIVSGALVRQEGFTGVALTSAASGASLWIALTGVWVLPVAASTVKGDKLYAATAESAGITLGRTATTGLMLVGQAFGDRDADGNALVLLLPQSGAINP
jgi:predicted RecA/RadA family phage recombinase